MSVSIQPWFLHHLLLVWNQSLANSRLIIKNQLTRWRALSIRLRPGTLAGTPRRTSSTEATWDSCHLEAGRVGNSEPESFILNHAEAFEGFFQTVHLESTRLPLQRYLEVTDDVGQYLSQWPYIRNHLLLYSSAYDLGIYFPVSRLFLLSLIMLSGGDQNRSILIVVSAWVQ